MPRPRKINQAHRRRTGQNIRKFLGVFAQAAILILLSGGFVYKFYAFAKTSEQFSVRTIQIEGIHELDEYDILYASGLTIADNVVFFDAARTRRNVEALPYVKRCEVVGSFPDTVILKIEERVAVATLMVNSRAYQLDNDRFVLREYAPGEMPAVPFITGVPGLDVIVLGEALDHPALVAAMEIWEAFSSTSLSEALTVSELAALSHNDVRMFCDEVPYEIRWGRGDWLRQAQRFDLLWTAKDGDLPCTEYLDLRFEEDLACR
ncbi:MAG: FtsQ-type POTRA domain-containing protein [Candidatus Hydrogenedentes bacterium]|nr:FtsQ-type POTRA domain-containing protein [Candidatus Hydrogenedentota bacterium]